MDITKYKSNYYVYIWRGYKINWIENNFRISYRYTGYTNNLKRRLKEHKSKKKWLFNIKYIYIKEFETQLEAMRYELFLKSIKGKIWLYKNVDSWNN